MHRLNPCVAVVFLVTSCSAFGATAQSYVAATTELVINGVSCGKVYSAEGGDPRTTVVVEASAAGLPKKHVAGVSYAPIIVEVAFPLPQPIFDWVSDLCANGKTRKTLLLKKYNFNGLLLGNSLQANNTLLTEARFPALDAGSKDAARMTLVFTPESTQASTAAATPPPAPSFSKPSLQANYRIQVGTLPSTKIVRIEPFTISGDGTGPTVFPNLVLTIDSADSAAWNTWRDSFVVGGINDDASEKGASLELQAADKSTLLTLQFSQVGIIRASPLKDDPTSDTIPRFQAELYSEGLAIGAPPAPPLTVLPVAPSTATLVVPGQGASVPPDSAPTPAVTDPGDLGARDPAKFPRPEGMVRKTFSSIRQKTSLQEIATYSSKSTVDAMEEIYTNTLTSGGWELTSKFENNFGTGARHQIILNWKNALRSVTVTLTDYKDLGSEVAVNLTTSLVP